jgi:TonB family protein
MNVQCAEDTFHLEPTQVVAAPSAPERSYLRLWGLAALAALTLHAVCIGLLVAHFQTEDFDDDLGAPAIEIGVELTAPQLEPTDLPPGPEAEEAAASPEIAEQKAKPEETELPQALPNETEDPDRLVAPDASHKPIDDDPKIKTVETMASTQSAASEATAPPTSDSAIVSPRSTAPAQGTGASARQVRTTWEKQLASHFDRHKRYPGSETRRTMEIVVSFTLDRLGRVVSAAIVKSSGDAAFDEAALSMVRRSDPVPQPPPLVADAGLSFTLPVIFRSKDRR